MEDFFGKPVRTALGIALIGAVVADVAVDGVQDFDYDGTARILAVNSSAPSSDPSFFQVPNPIAGDDYEVTLPPGEQAGERRPGLTPLYSLDELLKQPTDVSGGQAISSNWVPYRAGRRWS